MDERRVFGTFEMISINNSIYGYKAAFNCAT
jgi:hypothetical protein